MTVDASRKLPRSRSLRRVGDPADSGCEDSPNRDHAPSLARQSLKQLLPMEPRIHSPASCNRGHESGTSGSLPGAARSTRTAILSREVFARSFASGRQLGSYLSLTPSAYHSGSTMRCQGISKASNSWARRILIEIAWFSPRQRHRESSRRGR
jgi:transposase